MMNSSQIGSTAPNTLDSHSPHPLLAYRGTTQETQIQQTARRLGSPRHLHPKPADESEFEFDTLTQNNTRQNTPPYNPLNRVDSDLSTTTTDSSSSEENTSQIEEPTSSTDQTTASQEPKKSIKTVRFLNENTVKEFKADLPPLSIKYPLLYARLPYEIIREYRKQLRQAAQPKPNFDTLQPMTIEEFESQFSTANTNNQ